MPYEFVDISSANQDVIGVDMALGDKIIEKLSDKLGVEVKKKVEDTTFTANLAAVAADQVDIMLAGMSPLRNAAEYGLLRCLSEGRAAHHGSQGGCRQL